MIFLLAKAFGKGLDEKNINACINLWGYDVYHDWDWWRVQLPYFLEKIL